MRFAALIFFAFCAATSVRLAVAAHSFDLDTSATVRRAADEVKSSEYAERLAAIDPDRAREALEPAIRWNPRSSSALIALGLAKERAGDLEGATRDLLRAAEVDRQYLPAWTLANFYFRRGDRQEFRKWARRSAELVPGDLEPLLALCDRMEHGDALAALRNAPLDHPGDSLGVSYSRAVLPAVTGEDQPRVLTLERMMAAANLKPSRDGHGAVLRCRNEKRFARVYLDLLIRENRLDEAERVAGTLVSDPEDAPRLAAFTTRLIDAGKDAAAVAMWHGPVNGDLRTAPSGEGFDWRANPVDGVTLNWTPGRLTFWLSGGQPETCILLEQPIPVEAGSYRLQFEYVTAMRGLRWMFDSSESAEFKPQNTSLADERNFSVGQRKLAWLRLIYRRDPGVHKAEGKIELRSIRWAAN